MSRIGKNPVVVPDGVSVQVAGDRFTAKGRRGELSLALSNRVTVTCDGGQVTVTPKSQSKQARAMWGTTRARISNIVHGVHEGFSRTLEITGVGYRAAVEGSDLVLSLGYSHPVRYPIPPDLTMTCDRPTSIRIEGSDKQRVGQCAAEIRAWRPPEPFKGKGVRYADEYVRRKEGKKK